MTSVSLDRICSVSYISEEDFGRLGPNYQWEKEQNYFIVAYVYIAELLLKKPLMADKAVLLGQFKCLKSYEEHFYEGFVMSKYYSVYNFSWQ